MIEQLRRSLFPHFPPGNIRRICRRLCLYGILVLPVLAQASPPPGYDLVWSDEFNSNALDMSKWDYRHSGIDYFKHHSKDEDFYLAKNITVTNGCLVLTETSVGGTNYGAQVSTENSFNPTYGYFETRMQSAQMSGTVSAFWVQTRYSNNSNNNPATNGVELDIIENRPLDDMADNALHWNSYAPGLAQKVENYFGSPKPFDAFHVYGMLWTPTNYVFYIDGKQVWGAGKPMSHQGEFIDLMLRSSLHSRGDFGAVSTARTQARFDYVRYYAKSTPAGQIAAH